MSKLSVLRDELFDELLEHLDSLNDLQCRNIMRRISTDDLITLVGAIRKAKDDAYAAGVEHGVETEATSQPDVVLQLE